MLLQTLFLLPWVSVLLGSDCTIPVIGSAMLLVSTFPNTFLIDTCVGYFFSEESFPRLGQMILDYENPLKKLAEQFVPHQQVKEV